MKKILFGLIATVFFGNLSFGQTSCIPDLSFFPKELRDKISNPIILNSNTNLKKSTSLSNEQKNILNYFENFNTSLNKTEKVSEKDIKTIEDLIKKANENSTYQWVVRNASKTSSFKEFHEMIEKKIKTSKNSIEIDELILIDYSLQIISNKYYNSSNKTNNVFLNTNSFDWWKSWGKCAASIVGGAITGSTTLGLAGAAVGTIALPVVGTVAGGAVGAIGGGIGGALTGAAAGC
jgi:hypothetical protein